MIRRDFTTTDGARYWLLITQVEHAHLSGLLAGHWSLADALQTDCVDHPLPGDVQDELLAAIAHHDDGWTEWEAEPRLDPAHGRPYSFMNELPLEESLAIWARSISVAREIGPLAGWMVASHFYALLETGNHTEDHRAIEWLQSVDIRRRAWLDEWQQAGANRSGALADRAAELLRACDFLSLWLCCDCPVAASERVDQAPPFVLSGLSGDIEFLARRSNESELPADPFAEPGWLATASPWPFDRDALTPTADAWLVPVQRYETSESLRAAHRPVVLRWPLARHR